MPAPTLLLLPGDGIGPEIFEAMAPIFDWLAQQLPELMVERRLAGYSAFATEGATISKATLERAANVDAVLFGSESTEEYLSLPKSQRPPPALLALRTAVGGYANLRPIKVNASLDALSPLKPEIIRGVDMVIVRELLGGLYFGKPSGIETVMPGGKRRAIDSLVYHSDEIERVALIAFELARTRCGKLCSVDKANVLATSSLWREIVNAMSAQFPDVSVSHMYVDNCAMQLVRNPGQFDVILTENTFGDILSDCAAMLGGSIGMLASASIGAARENGQSHGLYESIAGTAPDIAGQGVANPIGTVLSLAMALRYSLSAPEVAAAIENAVDRTLSQGMRTRDLGGRTSTCAMAQAIASNCKF